MIGAELRPLLFAIAYRMLGNAADAEDVVQEAYLRAAPLADAIANPRACLGTIVTRLCIDQLRSARFRRERTAGVTIPEPLDGDPTGDPRIALAFAESLSLAVLAMLQLLSPLERAAFILRELFDFEYDEIGEIIGKSAANCRQIVSRARRSVGGGRTRFVVPPSAVRETVERFVAAAATADVDALLAVLAPDVALHADAGRERRSYGRLRAVSRPVRGARAVARFVAAAVTNGPPGAVSRIAELNGFPVVLSYARGELAGMLCLDVASGRVTHVFVLADPVKLARVDTALHTRDAVARPSDAAPQRAR